MQAGKKEGDRMRGRHTKEFITSTIERRQKKKGEGGRGLDRSETLVCSFW
jgi:hypothetical protein